MSRADDDECGALGSRRACGRWVVGPTSLWREVQDAPNGGEAGGTEGSGAGVVGRRGTVGTEGGGSDVAGAGDLGGAGGEEGGCADGGEVGSTAILLVGFHCLCPCFC